MIYKVSATYISKLFLETNLKFHHDVFGFRCQGWCIVKQANIGPLRSGNTVTTYVIMHSQSKISRCESRFNVDNLTYFSEIILIKPMSWRYRAFNFILWTSNIPPWLPLGARGEIYIRVCMWLEEGCSDPMNWLRLGLIALCNRSFEFWVLVELSSWLLLVCRDEIYIPLSLWLEVGRGWGSRWIDIIGSHCLTEGSSFEWWLVLLTRMIGICPAYKPFWSSLVIFV